MGWGMGWLVWVRHTFLVRFKVATHMLLQSRGFCRIRSGGQTFADLRFLVSPDCLGGWGGVEVVVGWGGELMGRHG